MAVQAQYPSNFLLLNRREQARKEMESESALQAGTGLLGHNAVFVTDGANGNARKRGREAAGVPVAAPPTQQQSYPVSFFSLQPQPCSPAHVSLAQLQMQPHSLVSTGLGLAPEDRQPQQHPSQKQSSLLFSSSSSASSLFSGELAEQVNHQTDEIEKFLLAQGEELRLALADRRKTHYRALLRAAEESAARRLREKDAEVERATRRRAELEDRLARLRTESMAWQAKAMADQATAASLHAQLQQAAAAPPPPTGAGDGSGDAPGPEDAESAYVDPDRVERSRACRSCRWRRASVVLLPCRHLCLCDACDAAAAAAESCPVCACVTTGSVRVFRS